MSDERQKVTENPQEFLMRTLSKDQWQVVAECLRIEVDSARADERGKVAEAIAQAIEANRDRWGDIDSAEGHELLTHAARLARDGRQ